METLLEDYKRKLKNVNEMLDFDSNINNGSINDIKRFERLNTKASQYRAFIVDIERAIKRETERRKEENIKLIQNQITYISYLENQMFISGKKIDELKHS